MSDFKSLEHLTDFGKRIENIDDPRNERFVRVHVAGIVNNCPVEVLTKIASAVYLIRHSELESESQGN